MTALDWIVASLFAAWLLLTLRFHIPLAGQQPLRRFDVLGFIPDWRFFAPHPPQYDYALLYRDGLADGEQTQWTEIRVVETRRWYNFVWNPHRRTRKALFDITTDLAFHMTQWKPDEIHLAVPYIAILQYVTALPRTTEVAFTQFALMTVDENDPAREPEVMFVSQQHES